MNWVKQLFNIVRRPHGLALAGLSVILLAPAELIPATLAGDSGMSVTALSPWPWRTWPGRASVDRLGDVLPIGCLFRIGTTRLSLNSLIHNVTTSRDGKLAVAAAVDCSAGVWRISDGQEICRLDRPVWDGSFLLLSSNGKSLLINRWDRIIAPNSSSQSKTPCHLCLVDVCTNQVLHSLGQRALCGSLDKGGVVLTVVQGEPSHPNYYVCRWDINTGKSLTSWRLAAKFPKFSPEALVKPRISSDGTLAITLVTDKRSICSPRATIWFHDAITGTELRNWPLNEGNATDLAVSPNNEFIALLAKGSILRVLESGSGKELAHWDGTKGNATYQLLGRLAFSPDGASIYCATSRGLLSWVWRTNNKVKEYRTGSGPFAFGGDGKHLLVETGTALEVVDLATGAKVCPIIRPRDCIGFSNALGLITWAEQNSIVVASARNGKQTRRWLAHASEINLLAVSPDGGTVASADRGDIRLWDLRTGRHLQRLAQTDAIGIGFSSDGSRLAALLGNSDELRIWDLKSEARHSRRHAGNLVTVDGSVSLVACAEFDTKTVVVRDALTGRLTCVLPGYNKRFGNPALRLDPCLPRVRFTPVFSPDGRMLLVGAAAATGTSCGAFELWRLRDRMRLPVNLDEETWDLRAPVFSPDSRYVLALRADRRMRLLSTAKGSVVREFDGTVEGFSVPPAFTPNGETLVTAGNDGTLEFWEVMSGDRIGRRQGHRGRVKRIVLAADGCLLATVGADQTILVWDLQHLATERRRVRVLARPELQQLWVDLGSAKGLEGRRAMELLHDAGRIAVEMVCGRIKPVPIVKKSTVVKWIMDLDADQYEIRERAHMELRPLGEFAAAELREARRKGLSMEGLRRVDDLLRELNVDGAESEGTRRERRVVQLLAWSKDPKARATLDKLASGLKEAKLTRMAQAALDRLVALENQTGKNR